MIKTYSRKKLFQEIKKDPFDELFQQEISKEDPSTSFEESKPLENNEFKKSGFLHANYSSTPLHIKLINISPIDNNMTKENLEEILHSFDNYHSILNYGPIEYEENFINEYDIDIESPDQNYINEFNFNSSFFNSNHYDHIYSSGDCNSILNLALIETIDIYESHLNESIFKPSFFSTPLRNDKKFHDNNSQENVKSQSSNLSEVSFIDNSYIPKENLWKKLINKKLSCKNEKSQNNENRHNYVHSKKINRFDQVLKEKSIENNFLERETEKNDSSSTENEAKTDTWDLEKEKDNHPSDELENSQEKNLREESTCLEDKEININKSENNSLPTQEISQKSDRSPSKNKLFVLEEESESDEKISLQENSLDSHNESKSKLSLKKDIKDRKEERPVKYITLRNQIEGNCCRKSSSISFSDSDDESIYYKGAGNKKLNRKSSVESSNRRTVLARRLSHRVILLQPSINDLSQFQTLHNLETLEETFENLSFDEKSVNASLNPCQLTLLKNSSIQYDKTAQEIVLSKCNQREPYDFNKFYYERYARRCSKIGEGVFGEVFSFDDETRKSVIKIIPIEGDQLVNGEPQKTFQEILSEIIITQELSNLRKGTKFNTSGFIELIGCYCLQGCYPVELIVLWNKYDYEKESENDSPNMFKHDQLYIVLELSNGGLDLEAYEFTNSRETLSIFNQITFALAVAEGALEFEHRDLHWGNLLVNKTKNSEENFTLNGVVYTIPTWGVKVSIIDFTLSRMTYDKCCIFNDLALDPSLFTAQGDYQFQIYRLMQTKIKNKWSAFEPYNNILWLHYILDKMKKEVRYRNINSRTHVICLKHLSQHFDKILDNPSASHYAQNCILPK